MDTDGILLHKVRKRRTQNRAHGVTRPTSGDFREASPPGGFGEAEKWWQKDQRRGAGGKCRRTNLEGRKPLQVSKAEGRASRAGHLDGFDSGAKPAEFLSSHQEQVVRQSGKCEQALYTVYSVGAYLVLTIRSGQWRQ
jgi:hypothetical protein